MGGCTRSELPLQCWRAGQHAGIASCSCATRKHGTQCNLSPSEHRQLLCATRKHVSHNAWWARRASAVIRCSTLCAMLVRTRTAAGLLACLSLPLQLDVACRLRALLTDAGCC